MECIVGVLGCERGGLGRDSVLGQGLGGGDEAFDGLDSGAVGRIIIIGSAEEPVEEGAAVRGLEDVKYCFWVFGGFKGLGIPSFDVAAGGALGYGFVGKGRKGFDDKLLAQVGATDGEVGLEQAQELAEVAISKAVFAVEMMELFDDIAEIISKVSTTAIDEVEREFGKVFVAGTGFDGDEILGEVFDNVVMKPGRHLGGLDDERKKTVRVIFIGGAIEGFGFGGVMLPELATNGFVGGDAEDDFDDDIVRGAVVRLEISMDEGFFSQSVKEFFDKLLEELGTGTQELAELFDIAGTFNKDSMDVAWGDVVGGEIVVVKGVGIGMSLADNVADHTAAKIFVIIFVDPAIEEGGGVAVVGAGVTGIDFEGVFGDLNGAILAKKIVVVVEVCLVDLAFDRVRHDSSPLHKICNVGCRG